MSRISVVIPAHNEQRHLPACLDSVRRAAASIHCAVEVVVVANRCTDSTAAIAERSGARVVIDQNRTIAAVRNAGVRHSTGEIVVTIDADSLMHHDPLGEVERHLATGRFIGGGTSFVTERRSVGIDTTVALVRFGTLISGLGGAMYWFRRNDFDAIDGFDERMQMADALDFARRLREYGRRSQRRFVMLRKVPVVTSCRKFDRFGDWYVFGMIRHPGEVRASMRGTDRAFADRYFYDFGR